jgi:hypothetical protein
VTTARTGRDADHVGRRDHLAVACIAGLYAVLTWLFDGRPTDARSLIAKGIGATVFGALFIAFARHQRASADSGSTLDGVRRWSRRHPVADSLLIIPILFVALIVADLAVVESVAISLAAGAGLAALTAVLRRRE